MKSFIYIDIWLIDQTYIGFATGVFDLERCPHVGDFISLNNGVKVQDHPEGLSFEISQLAPKIGSIEDPDFEFHVMCESDFFGAATEAQDALSLLGLSGFTIELSSRH